MTDEKRISFEAITEELLSVLDLQKSEYLRDFGSISKRPNESYTGYALRLKRLYQKGTGQKKISPSEKLYMVEQFLNGLNSSESTALRLVATEEEMKCVAKLAKRAARSKNSTSSAHEEVNALKNKLENLKVSMEEAGKAYE